MTDLPRIRLRTMIAPTCLILLTLPAAAQDLAWPAEAQLVRNGTLPADSLQLAIGPFDGGTVPTEWVAGHVSEQVWQIPGDDGDPARLLDALRTQLADQGFEVLYACADRQCGGFDFRYALPIAEGPDMHVDLGNFRYLAARREGEDGPAHVALTLSHGGRQGYAHLTLAEPAPVAAPMVTQSTRLPGMDLPAEDLITALLTEGRAVLADLDFETGASALSGAEYDSLDLLATFLDENPARRIVLVGHTDAEGALETNISLSEARARSVQQALLSDYGVDPTQVSASGVGFLAPLTANATEDGRQANRRVEAVLADIQ